MGKVSAMRALRAQGASPTSASIALATITITRSVSQGRGRRPPDIPRSGGHDLQKGQVKRASSEIANDDRMEDESPDKETIMVHNRKAYSSVTVAVDKVTMQRIIMTGQGRQIAAHCEFMAVVKNMFDEYSS